MKILFIIFGIISFILGAIGVVLPILPTTPFLLLSAFLFSKSSDRFHEYLIQTKLYQKYINEMVIERKTTKKKRNQSLFTVTLIFLIAVMILLSSQSTYLISFIFKTFNIKSLPFNNIWSQTIISIPYLVY